MVQAPVATPTEAPGRRPILLTAQQVAEETGFSFSKVCRLIRTGELVSLKLGGSRRIRYSDLMEYIDRHAEADAA